MGDIASRRKSIHPSVVDFIPASSPSLVAFLIIVLAVAAAFPAAVRLAHAGAVDKGRRATLGATVGVIAWIALVSGVVGSGLMAGLPLQGLPFFFAGVLIMGFAVGFSSLGGKIAAGVPLMMLVGFQAFRLPLELVLHSWAEQGTIPETMTWSGQNLDVISGCLAIIAAPLAIRSRAIAWVFNITGGLLLLNVIRVALLSSPIPIGWGQQPPLLLALHLPYALIAPICVAGAMAGHIILTRALLRPRN